MTLKKKIRQHISLFHVYRFIWWNFVVPPSDSSIHIRSQPSHKLLSHWRLQRPRPSLVAKVKAQRCTRWIVYFITSTQIWRWRCWIYKKINTLIEKLVSYCFFWLFEKIYQPNCNILHTPSWFGPVFRKGSCLVW